MNTDPGPETINSSLLIGSLIALFILLILSAYFSMTETAFTSFNKIRMENQAKDHKGAQAVLKISEHYDRVLSTILIGNNIVNIAASALATILFVNYYGEMGATLSTIVVTVVVLIFGEVSPKSLARENPEITARITVYPLYFFYVIFFPVGLALSGVQKLVKSMFGFKKKKAMYTEEEFSMLVEDMNEAHVLNDIEEHIIQNTIEYGDTKVEDVMVPAKEVDFFRIKDGYDALCKKFVDSNRSRIVVTKGSKLDSAFGVIHIKDLSELIIKGDKDFKKIIIKDLIITKPTNKISRLFKKLQSARQHLAIVKDEEKVVGIVTMEDILEELVGEIRDENDDE